MKPTLTPATRNRIEGRLKGMEEAKNVLAQVIPDPVLYRRIVVALEVRIREVRAMLEDA